jgi:hypothetical protein
MGAIVIVNWSALAWTPTQHQHFNEVSAANKMSPVVAVLETAVRREFFR